MQWSITLSIDFTHFVPTLRVLHPTHLTELHIDELRDGRMDQWNKDREMDRPCLRDS